MVKVLHIEGACVQEIDLETFSKAAILEWCELTEEDLIPEDEDDATDFTVEVGEKYTTATRFNSDGEAFFFIGLSSEWTGPAE